MADTSLNENRLGILIWQTSNLWQSKLRKKLKLFNLSLNEYLILEAMYKLEIHNKEISQVNISYNSSVDKSVISIKLNLLKSKKLIYNLKSDNNRSHNLSLSNNGKDLINKLIKIIDNEEVNFFNNLRDESFNFTNSLKLLLGKKLRVKANNYETN